MADNVETGYGGDEKVKRNDTEGDDSYELSQKQKTMADFRAEAIEAENVELNMTVLEAVRAYPMASLWAFVMSCTIVSRPFSLLAFAGLASAG